MTSTISLNQFITELAYNLKKKGFTNSKNEIIWYLEHLDICSRKQIYLDQVLLNNNIKSTLQFFFNARTSGLPFQYILKKGTFYGRDFYINEDVLIPRPETELLINILHNKFFNSALEIGTGSGVIACTLALEKIAKNITATDISSPALRVAQTNIQQFQISNIELQKHGFLTQNFHKKFNLIISNPPYISYQEYQLLPPHIKEHEPQIALTDALDGLSFYHRFAKTLKSILSTN